MTDNRWTSSDLPSFAGRRVVVTGANSGLGLVVTRELARVGAHVVLAVRDVARGRAVAGQIDGSTEVRALDLADLASIRRFADEWTGELDVLVNNAGIMLVPAGKTKDGFESQIGTNHLGHFALTNLLLPHLTDRVVTVSSHAHRRGTVDLDDLNWETRKYSAAGAYAQSKLANLLFTLELQRRLTAAGSLRAHSAHPGWAATNLQSHSGSRLFDGVMQIGNKLFAQDAAAGALPTLYAASQDLPPASYIGPGGPFELRGNPVVVGRSAAAGDAEKARRLWELSERLTGVPSSV
ncbi:oxidoreductase [Nocardia sp. NPDC006044]|uniref:oxidoreductase n=1 Tax=Nocardia sp. NPDC006044 TaxID=3364306 RepID=UPI0036BC9C3D